MKHSFRIIIGMLLLAIPLCLNAQVKPSKPATQQTQTQEPSEADRLMKEADIRHAEEQRQAQLEKQAEIKPATPPAQTHTPVVKPKKPATPPEKQVANPEKPVANPEKPEKPEPPKGGIEMPKISGFVQGMYQANIDNEGNLVSNTFRMRRVRLSVEGTLYKGLSYKIQGDFSRSPMLVDAYLKYKVADAFAIQLGQFKTPFSIESPINPVNLEIFDYGEVIQKLVGYSDVCGVGGLGRDIGLMATGSLFPIKGNEGIKYHVVEYALGVFNGNGPTTTDNNNRKDLVGRIEIHPGLKNLTLSGSYYYGKYSKDDNINCSRNRWAAGAQYNDGKLVVRGEYISGETGFATDVIGEQSFINSNGYYGVLGYNFALGKEKKQKLMPVLRYEHFAQNDAIENGGTNWYTVGLNYWPLKSVNFKLDYSLVQKETGDNSHRVVGILSYKF